MSNCFSLDNYEPEYESVEQYHESDETPFDHKKSPADGAIEYRQKAKGEKGYGRSTAPKSDSNRHMTKLEDPDKRESVSERVVERRRGKAHTQLESEKPDPSDPANW